MAHVLADITQGRRLARIDADGFTLHEVAYAGAREMPQHAHRTANITLLLSGQFEEQIDGACQLCLPLSVVFKPAGTVHAARCGDRGTRSLVLEITPELEARLRHRDGLFDRLWIHDAGPVAARLLSLWRFLRAGARPAEPFLDHWFALLAAAMPRTRSGARPICPHLRGAMDALCHSPRAPSTSHLARQLHLHPVYLARLFRQHLGCSPTRLRIRRQLSAA
jgi:quercetin dioxygenase-like cupin family protein